MTTAFAVIACTILALGLISERLKGSMLTPFMLCVLVGYFCGPRLGGSPELGDMEFILEFTLIMVLFSDACHLRRAEWGEARVLLRMLTLGIGASVLLGTVLGGLLFPSLGFWQAALLAATLTATDAALGQPLVESPLVPRRWREILLLESGLNDGLVVPLVFFFKICASAWAGFSFFQFWLWFIGLQIGGGLVAGLVVGYGGALILRWGIRAHAINRIFEHLSGVALAMLAYALAEGIGGNGFISVFVAGWTLGNVGEEVSEHFIEFTSSQAELMSLITFLLFGAFMVGPALETATWETWVYAVLTLTVLRLVAVGFSLRGLGLRRDQLFLLGIFGPRGIASLLFGLLVLETVAVVERELIFHIIGVTVLLSSCFHGLSAIPLAKWYGKRAFQRNEL